MTLSQASERLIIIAMVGYVLALLLHSIEWASARGLAPERPEDGSEDRARERVDLFGRLGVALTSVAVVTHVVGVVTRGIAADRLPWGNMYEFVTTALGCIAVIYLISVWRLSARWLGLGVTLLQTIGLGLAVTVFYVDVAPLVPALHSVWFAIHIIAAAVAGAAFNIGAIASILFLLRRRVEDRGGAIKGYLARIPTSKRLDLFSYRLHAFAFPLWTFAIAAGAIWAQYAWGRFWNWDPKETWSFVTWVVYAAYLHARATAGWKGRPAAVIALVGVVMFWFNFVGVNLLMEGLHSYSGI